MEILRYSAVKGLLRFRWVSMPWCLLIDSPDFIKLHPSHSHKTNTNLFLLHRGQDFMSVDFDSLKTGAILNNPIRVRGLASEIAVLCSCSGLTVLQVRGASASWDITVWNPSTRKFQKVPTSLVMVSAGVLLVNQVYGFGYDPSTDDYQLVESTYFYYYNPNSEVKVYSLSTNSWRKIKGCPFDFGDMEEDRILANNALH